MLAVKCLLHLSPPLYTLQFSLGQPNLKGTAYVIENEDECEYACSRIQQCCQQFSAVGFDAEWKPQWNKGQRRNNVALLQIATPQNGDVFLFRLNQLEYVHQCLADVLEDDEIIKVGVAPARDRDYIHQDYGVKTQGILDLRRLLNTKEGLQTLANQVLGLTLDKGNTTLSDWEQPDLSHSQVRYAAKDAYASVKIFTSWAGVTFNANGNSNCSWSNVLSRITEHIDVPSKTKRPLKHDLLHSTGGIPKCIVCSTVKDQLVMKNIVPTSYKNYFPRDNTIVDCCDTQLLCVACEKKTRAYTRILNDHLKYAVGHESVALSAVGDNIMREMTAQMYNVPGPKSVPSKFLRQVGDWDIDYDSFVAMPLEEAVVQLYLNNNQPLWRLQKLWRAMFVETMDPQIVPQCWGF